MERETEDSLESLRLKLAHYLISDHGMTQIYLGCSPQELESLLVEIKRVTKTKREIRVNFNPSDFYGNITSQVRNKMTATESEVLIVVEGFEETKIAGHTINQRVHLDFFEQGKNLMIYYLNRNSKKYIDAVETAKDSQFKAGIVEFL